MPKIAKIRATSDFIKNLKILPRNVQNAFHKKDLLFRQNPFDPALKTHKLKGKLRSLHAYSINYSYRVLFEFLTDDEVLYFDVGTHEIYK